MPSTCDVETPPAAEDTTPAPSLSSFHAHEIIDPTSVSAINNTTRNTLPKPPCPTIAESLASIASSVSSLNSNLVKLLDTLPPLFSLHQIHEEQHEHHDCETSPKIESPEVVHEVIERRHSPPSPMTTKPDPPTHIERPTTLARPMRQVPAYHLHYPGPLYDPRAYFYPVSSPLIHTAYSNQYDVYPDVPIRGYPSSNSETHLRTAVESLISASLRGLTDNQLTNSLLGLPQFTRYFHRQAFLSPPHVTDDFPQTWAGPLGWGLLKHYGGLRRADHAIIQSELQSLIDANVIRLEGKTYVSNDLKSPDSDAEKSTVASARRLRYPRVLQSNVVEPSSLQPKVNEAVRKILEVRPKIGQQGLVGYLLNYSNTTNFLDRHRFSKDEICVLEGLVTKKTCMHLVDTAIRTISDGSEVPPLKQTRTEEDE
ncbi:hypothetical protein RCL1_008917 [Eukaryota sp. TZLM3-RCL]